MMELSTRHLTDLELRNLLEESLDRRDLAKGLIHLAMCDRCRARFQSCYPDLAPARFQRWFGTSHPPQAGAISKLSLERMVRWGSEKVLAAVHEIEEAERLWLEISNLPPAQRRLRVTNSPRSATVGFAVAGLERAADTWLNDPETARDFADLSLTVLEALQDGVEGKEFRRLQDLRARAFTYRANCHRILGNFTEALQDFKDAHAALRIGSGDQTAIASTLQFEGTFLRDRRLLDQARRVLQAAAALYRNVGDVASEASVIVIEALVLREAAQPEVGVTILTKLVSQYSEREMGGENYYRCQYNLVLLTIDAGLLEQAKHRLPLVQQLVHRRNNRFDVIRLEWLEALLHEKSGEDSQAEEKYQNVQEFFLDEGIGYDAAFVSLDLAAFYLDRARYQEARDLATKLTPIFLADDIHREAVASLLLFQEAVDRQEATAALARATAKALREVQGRPAHENGSVH